MPEGRLITTFREQEGAITNVALTPDCGTVVTQSDGKTVRFWDATTGKLRVTLAGHQEMFDSPAFGPGGMTMLTRGGSDGRAGICWDTATANPFGEALRH